MFACDKIKDSKIKENERIREIDMQKLKADMIIMGIIGTAAFLFFVIPLLTGSTDRECVKVFVDGKLQYRYSLSENRTITVGGDKNEYNLILIHDGQVKVTDADCPDKLCVKQRNISRNGESIICLPHRMVVQIESEEESDLDAVTN